MSSELATALHQNQLFSVLSAENMAELASQLIVREFGAGEVIYRMDDPADTLYVVLSGLVKVCKLFPNGREAFLTIMKPEGVIGEVIFRRGEGYTTQAEALTSSHLLVISSAQLEQLICTYPELTLQMLRITTGQLLDTQTWAAELNAYNAPERVACLLLRLGFLATTAPKSGYA